MHLTPLGAYAEKIIDRDYILNFEIQLDKIPKIWFGDKDYYITI